MPSKGRQLSFAMQVGPTKKVVKCNRPLGVNNGRFELARRRSALPPTTDSFRATELGPLGADIVDKGIFDRWP